MLSLSLLSLLFVSCSIVYLFVTSLRLHSDLTRLFSRSLLFSCSLFPRSFVLNGMVPQDRFRKLVESDGSLNKWCSVPKVVHELVSKEVRCGAVGK